MQIKRSIEKIPGGMMLVPLFLGALCHTFSPGAGKYFGSFTNGMITGTLVVTKIAVAWVVAAIASRIIPEHGVEVGFFAGLSTLALVAAMDMTNGGLYASIMQQYGTKEEAGAFVLMSLESGPLMTMIILGTAGIAASSSAGAAVATPVLIAEMVPAFKPMAPAATSLVATAVIVTSILVPILTSIWSRKVKARAAKIEILGTVK
ncbi:2-keto-3-deoxygluconate permease [Escherichia coli]|uniref:2-keto-3-deoxygluconate permease n=1 Tax=Escherichia coli TaxID=562 RepID=UPI0015D754CF|nr:2-keto-3-deoxygluconate permease [Escherichia coli]NZA84624.1 2-keto-3-deoxygluconate permease [Escherichia coli]NZA89618.1 2-keto-3-deoxygluconate permease [Escherichia coli]